MRFKKFNEQLGDPNHPANATPKNITREVYRYRMMAAFPKMIDAKQWKPLVGAILQ